MSKAQIQVLEQAVREYEEDGVISTTTFMALTLVGLDANATLESIEETSNG